MSLRISVNMHLNGAASLDCAYKWCVLLREFGEK